MIKFKFKENPTNSPTIRMGNILLFILLLITIALFALAIWGVWNTIIIGKFNAPELSYLEVYVITNLFYLLKSL